MSYVIYYVIACYAATFLYCVTMSFIYGVNFIKDKDLPPLGFMLLFAPFTAPVGCVIFVVLTTGDLLEKMFTLLARYGEEFRSWKRRSSVKKKIQHQRDNVEFGYREHACQECGRNRSSKC